MKEDEEKEHFQRIVQAFKYYRTHSLARLSRTELYLNSLPKHHQATLTDYRKDLANFRSCIEHNNKLIQLIIKDVTYMFENVRPPDASQVVSDSPFGAQDVEKVQATLKQFVRDWSEEGAVERNACYQPIIDEIIRAYPKDGESPLYDVRVLVPGAGLGRLAFEIAKRGFSCQGNEFSLFMLFASNFVLNKCRTVNEHKVYPWVHQYDNNMSAEDQTKEVRFPDVSPADLESGTRVKFTMVAGDFLEVYKGESDWNCIATCFFIDCANNIAAFIETIFHILLPGGLWINLGPLLYHFSNTAEENSIEPSYEVVKSIIRGTGFIFEKEETGVDTTYAQNPNSMLQYRYRSVFFVCRKPAE